ncbi:hypothetical protein HanRHA438_Chr14g0651651 [Helianthus annuus]|nr:hypothetical protein HanRHA438_Chr14g0651651 [Helianthus annuus]
MVLRSRLTLVAIFESTPIKSRSGSYSVPFLSRDNHRRNTETKPR